MVSNYFISELYMNFQERRNVYNGMCKNNFM